tara:strand:- start:132 stop:515 length:384 start_codon:yes stop_codon:yes gene_type:complete
MGYRERVIYIIKIVVLICIIAWLLFTNRERYVEEYNAKIEALEQKVDSLHGINDELTFKIDTLNNEIVKLDKEINVQDNRIRTLKWKINEKVIAVDTFSNIELYKFFTERYRQYFDSIRSTSSEISN